MKLPRMTPKDLMKLLQKHGFRILRQTGSHVRLTNENGKKVTVALHNKPIAKGTLSAILRQADLKKDDL